MLTVLEKQKVKDVLGDGLGINRNINLAYFLNAIEATKKETSELKTKLDLILYNQKILESKLNSLYQLILSKKV